MYYLLQSLTLICVYFVPVAKVHKIGTRGYTLVSFLISISSLALMHEKKASVPSGLMQVLRDWGVYTSLVFDQHLVPRFDARKKGRQIHNNKVPEAEHNKT